MVITIHQPSYLPWLPFLEKAIKCDIFVFLDDVQFEKNSEQNRNKLKTSQGPAWLTVPVRRKLHTLIPDVVIPRDQNTWKIKHRKTIELNYKNAPFYNNVAPLLFAILDKEWKKLLDLNLAIDKYFFSLGNFRGRTVRSSKLNIKGEKSDRILAICKELGAKTYLSGRSGTDYLNLESFAKNDVEVLFQNYHLGEYSQQYPELGFIPRLSALDLFMNTGVCETAQQNILLNSRWLSIKEMKIKKKY